MNTVVSISIDWALIVRCLGAVSWGIIYALFLQHHRLGQFWIAERTWITVTIGVGMCFAIGINSTWTVQFIIMSLGALPVIIRSLINESRRPPIPTGYKVLWGLEDAMVITRRLIEQLEGAIESESGPWVKNISQAVGLAHHIFVTLRDTRAGEYTQKKDAL
jgi:hypothetical protein